MNRRALLLGLSLFTLGATAQTFEVATLKPSPPATGDTISINLGAIQGTRLTLANATLGECLQFAYGLVSSDQLSGPDWIKSREVRYDIDARAAEGATADQIRLMLRRLLNERLHLTLHTEQKTFSYLALSRGSNLKLQEVQPQPVHNSTVLGRIEAAAMPMLTLTTLLSRFERQVVIDQTGLAGLYRFTLEWSLDNTPTGTPQDHPSLQTALRDQLGLKLDSKRGPLDVIVVDRADKVPVEN